MNSIPRASGIYQILCIPTGKVYVGSAQNIAKRWGDHRRELRANGHHSILLQRAWNKYGEDQFRLVVIELVLISFLLEREQYWIDQLKATNPQKGFNINPTAGSALGRKATDETRQRLSESHKGQKHPPRSAETLARMSEAQKGKTLSEAVKQKLSALWKGRVIQVPPETRARNNAAMRKAYIITAPDGTEYEVIGLNAFCREHDLHAGNMGAIASGKGRLRSYKGWKCRYKE